MSDSSVNSVCTRWSLVIRPSLLALLMMFVAHTRGIQYLDIGVFASISSKIFFSLSIIRPEIHTKIVETWFWTWDWACQIKYWGLCIMTCIRQTRLLFSFVCLQQPHFHPFTYCNTRPPTSIIFKLFIKFHLHQAIRALHRPVYTIRKRIIIPSSHISFFFFLKQYRYRHKSGSSRNLG